MHTCSVMRIGFQFELGKDAGEIDARAEFRRQYVHLQSERAEARLHAEVAGYPLGVILKNRHVPGAQFGSLCGDAFEIVGHRGVDHDDRNTALGQR